MKPLDAIRVFFWCTLLAGAILDVIHNTLIYLIPPFIILIPYIFLLLRDREQGKVNQK